MKKVFITALVAAMATSSFAQKVDIVKDMKGKSYAEATAVLNAALPTLSAEQKAKGYNQLVEINYPEASKAYETAQLAAAQGQEPNVDFMLFVNTLNDAVASNKYDNEPNDKGKVAPKFAKKNSERLFAFRGMLINAANSTQDNDKKMVYSEAVINSAAANSPLFAAQLAAGDKLAEYAYFFGSYGYYNNKNFKKAAEYAKKAMVNEDVKSNAESVYVNALMQTLQTKADTLAYIDALKEVDAQKYLANIASMYNAIGEKALATKMLDDEIAANPGNKMAYAIKGENAMMENKWDEAIENFKKTVEIDPAFTQVWFNLGVCQYSLACDLNDKLSDNGRISTENQAKVNEKIADAKVSYEKVREQDPDHTAVPNWPYQLRMIYNALGEKEKADEISKMLGD